MPYLAASADTIADLRVKTLIGFSDITALLLYFYKHYPAWRSIHGLGAEQLVTQKVDAASIQATFDFLQNQEPLPAWTDLRPLNQQATTTKTITAPLVGGNLSLFTITIRDLNETDTSNNILLLEDVNEKGHRIERNIKYLQRVQALQQPKAIIFGNFTSSLIGCTADEQAQNNSTIITTLQNLAEQLPCPVFATEQFGHGHRNMPLG